MKFGKKVLSRDCSEIIKLLRMAVITQIRILSKMFRGMRTQDGAKIVIFSIPPIKKCFLQQYSRAMKYCKSSVLLHKCFFYTTDRL